MKLRNLLILAALSVATGFAQQPVIVPGWAGGTLGAMANYGTSPGAVLVPGVNAFVTNTVADNLAQVNGVGLGSPSNYGTSPGAVAVMGVNSYVTNSLSVATWASGTLGSMANYGTSPGAVLVPGVNAFVTNASSIGSPTPQSTSTYAFSKLHSSSAAAGNIKASAGNLYGLVLGNSGSVPCWMQLFNNASTPTAGTSVVDSVFVQAGLTVVIPPGGLALENFATGIAYAGATSDSGATTTGCTTTFSVTAYYN